jgi:hypothetical protein
MPAHGVKLLNGKEPQLRKLVYELRYERGFVYLDRCGRILDRITRDKPEWVPSGDVNPQVAPLFNITNRSRFTFGPKKLDLSLDQSFPGSALIDETGREEFVRTADEVSRFIVQELQLTSFSRIGIRSYFHFSTEDEEESQRWLAGLELFTVSQKLLDAFRGELAASGLAIVLVGDDCRYRIELSGIETVTQLDMGAGQALGIREKGIEPSERAAFNKNRLKMKRERDLNTGFVVQIDVDAYQEFPKNPDFGQFATQHTENVLQSIRSAAK